MSNVKKLNSIINSLVESDNVKDLMLAQQLVSIRDSLQEEEVQEKEGSKEGITMNRIMDIARESNIRRGL